MEMLGAARQTDVGGFDIAWGEMGDGPPLVLLHGMLDSHRTWRRAAPRLAKRFRVLMPDLPGHGYSGRPDAPYTLAWQADVMGRWMQCIGLEAAHICGHSYGAGLAMYMLLGHRDRLRRLALVSAGGLGREVAAGMRLAAFPLLGARLTPSVLRLTLPAALRLAAPAFGNMEPEERDRMLRITRIPGTLEAFQKTLAGVINLRGQSIGAVERAGEVDELPAISMFWGNKDPVIPIKHAHATQERLRGTSLVTYPGCGHFPQLDRPESFADDLAEFLSDPSRGPAVFVPAP